ncbi:helix-turn-helix transcriptional regulator [Streptomyces sp. AC602_WCS936]|uniref:ArsR/SmtB family transcription factor n=1 Tax=Streptomyces sp. AC602_WCS936 TaxID=2823685 RepID=UPI001C2567CE|nr:helix-turn-helix domain-containing protein [Streptomyces sp. AC602_WCS936]
MEQLEQRVADLERRLAALEATDRPAPRPKEGDFWALEGLKEQLTELGAAAGGVLFTGSVRLPSGEQYGWQHGALTDGLMDADWAESADAFAALGHPVRLRLLREIVGGRRTAAELAELDGMGTTGQIYHHLRLLTAAGWLHTTGRGRHEVPPGRVVPLLVALSTARN